MTVEHHTGDALATVATLHTDSVDLVACSPPFLALRNYNDIDGQWGSEPTPAAFLDHLLELTVELRRVLTPTGSIAIELGDKYNVGEYSEPLTKSMCMTPMLFAASLAYGHNLLNPDHQFDPWRIRNVIVWARNNPPVGALGDKYRPATSYITVACPSGRRWFDLDAVRTEPKSGIAGTRLASDRQTMGYRGAHSGGTEPAVGPMARPGSTSHRTNPHLVSDPAGAPPLDHWDDTEHLTWNINTHGSSLAHYAMWPPKLAERLILSMCPAEVCVECKEPRKRITEPTERYASRPFAGQAFVTGDRGNGQHQRNTDRPTAEFNTLGWSDCGHGNHRPGHVLDPFSGTGTTLAVADIHGRDATGIDLDPANPDLYAARYAECWRALKPGPSPVTPHGTQLGLLDSEAT